DRDNIKLELITHETNKRLRSEITGSLLFSDAFKNFGINSGKVWAPTELGLFIKMNRAYFTDKTVAMSLTADLMNFKGKVDAVVEKSAKETGDRTDNFSQTVNSNLPKAFKVKMPIFKGGQAEEIEVETFANIDGRVISL